MLTLLITLAIVFLVLAYFIFNFGEWDFNKEIGEDCIYLIDSYDIEKNILKSKNGILMNMKTEDLWNRRIP